MSALYSDQYNSVFNGQNASPLKDNEWGGKVRSFYFTRTTSASYPVASGDTIALVRLPKGSRILEGFVAFEAMGSSTTATIGTSASAAKYLGSTSVASAGTAGFANTVALSYGEELSADTDIILTAGGANYANDKAIKGHILVALT